MDKIRHLCKHIEPVGSRVTCSPAPTDTDEDFLCLVSGPDAFWKLITHLQDNLYELGGSDVAPVDEYVLAEWEGFQSYKKGDVNLIVTCSEKFFGLFMEASDEAKRLNLLAKEDRIALFQKILYGEG
jgi:hypothetical protein